MIICVGQNSYAQESPNFAFPEHFSKTSIAALKNNDSLLFYQCHVEEATTQITTTSGAVISGDKKRISITDKFVVVNNNGKYKLKYYSSTLSNLPNRKFTYLKIKEKDYWNFKLEKESVLNEHDVLMFAAIENKAHETTEYDFVIDKYNTNGLIIRNKKVMRHLVLEGNYVLKKNLEVLK
jgi:hypothetical protein